MTAVPLAQLIRRTSDQLVERRGVDAGLANVVRAVDRAGAPSEAVKTASDLLHRRSRELEAACDELEELRTSVSYLANMLRFTAEGWPERQADLEGQLAKDPVEGTAAWLEDWFTAASCRRTDALERLETVSNLPPGAALLRERCTLAARGLDERNWYLAEPLLAAGASGLKVGQHVVPSDVVRSELQLLRVRLALAERFDDEADEALRAIESSSPSPAARALRARWHRQRGERDEAARLLDDASLREPSNLDVTSELVEQARADGRGENALDAARAAVERLPVLADVQGELGRLVAAPAELWIAVADRALTEGDLDINSLAVDHAEGLVPPDDAALRASVAELAADGAEAGNASGAELVATRMRAGVQDVEAGELERAVTHFERILELEGDNAEAKLRLADCRLTLIRDVPLAAARSGLEDALTAILDTSARGAVDSTMSWCYLSEAETRERLAADVALRDNEHAWRAFLAVCRSIVHQEDASLRWADLAPAAQSLSLYRVALAASAHAVQLDADNQFAAAQYIQALANAGQTKEALERLENPVDDWDQAVRGYLLTHTGDMWQGAAVLRTANLDPNWSWAAEKLITALLLTDRYDEALAEALAHRAHWADRCDEFDGAWTTAWSSVVLDDLEFAQELADRLAGRDDEAQSHAITGMVQLLQGNAEAGLAALRAKIAGTRAHAELAVWSTIFLAPLHVLAAHRGISLPPLDSLDDALDERRAVLQSREDPVEELARAPVRGADPVAVAVSRALGAALLHAARGQLDAALNALDPAIDAYPDDAELVSLRSSIRAQLNVQAADKHWRDLAHEAVAATRKGATEVATSALRKLMTEVPNDADDLLRREAEGDEETLHRVARVLEGFLERDTSIVDWLLGSERPPPETLQPPLTALLPSSWFAGHDDPLTDHPLFLRYIPEARARASWGIPPINVRADDELEPDRFRILVLGDLVDEGRAAPSCVYGTREALTLLGPELETVADHAEGLGLMQVPAAAVAESGAFAELLTMPAAEVVARRIGQIAEERATLLGGPPPQTTWRRFVTTAVRRVTKAVGPSG